MKKVPGLFNSFKGLWVRGPVENCPPDHFTDSENNSFVKFGVGSRDATGNFQYAPALAANEYIVRKGLYKPNPPFSGTNIPRVLALTSIGRLIDCVTGVVIKNDPIWKDFTLVNFFGRCYISPHDGKIGLQFESIYVYDGATLRLAAGVAPNVAMTAAYIAGGNLYQGTYIFAYAFETSSGHVTGMSPKTVISSHAGNNQVNITNLPLGPAGTAARWLIATKLIPEFQFPPFDFSYTGNEEGYPFYFAVRIPDNTTTAYVLNFFDENLIDSADYLLTNLATIPAGVGLLDYQGRMVSWGEYTDSTLVRVSTDGEPESFSSTSGFIITDPTDNTGVRDCVEWLKNLYIFKRQRGYVTQDNGDDASTWHLDNFEKAIGTEHSGIATVLDAKGSSSLGFIIGSISGIYFFNGAVVEPELSFKIIDLWKTINSQYFHQIMLFLHTENKRLYVLAPLYGSVRNNFLLVGDYRDGLNGIAIKWDKWSFSGDLTDILIYEDFTADMPKLVTLISNLSTIKQLTIDTPGSVDNIGNFPFFILPPVRFSEGITQFTRVRCDAKGPGTISLSLFDKDLVNEYPLMDISPESSRPGREYTIFANVVSEHAQLKVYCKSGKYGFTSIKLEGSHLWDERPT